MKKTYILALALLIATTGVSAASYSGQTFWEPFIQQGQFNGDIIVGDDVGDVIAAVNIAMVTQTKAMDSHITGKHYTDFNGQNSIIITSGNIEKELQPVFAQCNIDPTQYSELATFCIADNNTYYIVYGQDQQKIIDLGHKIAAGQVEGFVYEVKNQQDAPSVLSK